MHTKQKLWCLLLELLVLFGGGQTAVFATPPPTFHKQPIEQLLNDFGYGASTAHWGNNGIRQMNFNWVKIYDPPHRRKPNNMLWRIDVNGHDAADLDSFAAEFRRQIRRYDNFVEAYEIGNEVNLGQNGWEQPPNAASYAALLCRAHAEIKLINPNAIVVSAGLAPVGRIEGNWNGQIGHNGQVQDEREFMQAFLAAGGGDCADVIGYHPIGFRADFDAEPDVNGGAPESNCDNGFCFRGAEKIYEILVANGYGQKKIWATEVGWLRTPPTDCLAHPSWVGRGWQTVSPLKQGQNLAGAFRYAREKWSWLGAMFVFNYDFADATYYDSCEQMRYYGIRNQPAEAFLTSVPFPVRAYLPLVHFREDS
ncbi:MAG: hypothetical protein H6668_01560 [Ardenticatenaceae bacterium]|nr:hypothetical protein [Ardenticatenaceae bacterium]